MALAQPRIVDHGALTIVGLSKRHTSDTLAQVKQQWFELQSRLAGTLGRVDAKAYGVWYDVLTGGGQFTYLAGVAVGEFAPVNPQFTRGKISPLRYAVFQHQGSAQDIRQTVDAILNQWLPQSGQELAKVENAPDFIEVYSEQFNQTGQGAIEVWVPIKKR